MLCKDKESKDSRNTQRFIIKCERPQLGSLKRNVDTAVDEENGNMGFGWVLRNEVGIFKAAVSKVWKGVCQPREADAAAIKEALS